MIFQGKKHKNGFKTYVVESLNDYITLICQIYNDKEEYWYRGQSNANYRLIPSGLREVFAIEDARGNKFEKPIPDFPCSGSNNTVAFPSIERMVAEFAVKAKPHMEYTVNNIIEWECIAQHYGLPTRMLDWSTNALDALYFAVCDCNIGEISTDYEHFLDSGFGECGGAVFIINPININKLTILFKDGIDPFVLDVNEHTKIIQDYLSSLLPPICINGINKEKRICRQSGNFTTTGILIWPLDYYQVIQDQMIKILIPYAYFEDIRRQLKSIGITHETIYVNEDLKDEITKNIALQAKEKFHKDLFDE